MHCVYSGAGSVYHRSLFSALSRSAGYPPLLNLSSKTPHHPPRNNTLYLRQSSSISYTYSFERTASSLYLTSFNTFVVGFHSSNCFSSSVTSVSSSVFTKSSSSSPRIIQGRTYGLAFVGTWYSFTSRGTSPTAVVSKATSIARLLQLVMDWWT
jgi:hypothetical protein